MASRASSESACSSTESERALELLTNASALSCLMRDVECLISARAPQRSLVGIKLSDSFDYLVALYEVLRKQICDVPAVATEVALQASPRVCPFGHRGHNFYGAARWLLLLSFLIRACPSMYTAWKDRRDLLLADPCVALQASHDTVDAMYQASGVKEAEGQGWGGMRNLAQQWLPACGDLCTQAATHGAAGCQLGSQTASQDSNALPCRFSVWRTVRWELRCSARFVQLGHKNFQLWHHRKELLVHALASLTAAQRAALTQSSMVAESLEQYLRRGHDMSFADINECALTEDVLLNLDSKNYHVWLYRSWFVHAFGFLVALPPLSVLDSVLVATSRAHAHAVADKNGCSVSATPALDTALLSHCNFAKELNFTTRLLAEDCWNNSAWCHRLQLVRDDLVLGVLQQVQFDAVGLSSIAWRVLDAACVLEWRYVLSCAVAEPANEAVFTYARAVALCHQGALLRLALVQAGLPAARLLQDAQPVVAQLAVYQTRQSVDAATHETEAMALNAREEEVACITCFRRVCHRLPWHAYCATFWLSFHELAVLHTHVVPALQRAEDRLGAALDTMTEMPSSALHYVIDNLYQTYAAEYHICFSILEQLWRVYFDVNNRAAVWEARPACFYVKHGAAVDLDSRIVQCADETSDAGRVVFASPTECFVTLEAWALHIAKKLVSEDAVRSKYWQHEVRVLLTRQYE